MYNEQNLPRSRENSDLAKAVELNSQELSSFSTKFHGSCAKCHHFHVGLPLTINNKPDHHERIYCEKCNHVLFGLGRGSPQVSLASVETKNTLPTKPISSPVRQSEKSNNPETKSIPTIPDPSTTPLSGPKTNERSIHNIKSSTKPGQISIGNPSSKYAFSSTKTKRAKTVLQGISSTARKLKPSFRKRTFSKPLVNVDACQTPEIPVAQEDARPVDDQFNMMSLISWGVPHRELSGREMIPSLSLPSQEEMRMTPELPNNPSSPLLPHNSENISDKVRNKHLEKISLGRDNRFRSASVPPNQRSDDQNFQKSSLERKENSSWSSIFSVESSISIRYRSQDGQRQRIESHSKSKIALENYKESKEGFTPSVGDFFLADNDDSDDDDNHGSTHSRVVQVEPKNSPAEKMDANGFSSGESDHASAFRESDGRITRLENNFLRLRFRCVSRLSDC